MRPEYVFLRCSHCGRVYQSTAALVGSRLAELRPVLNAITTTCPACGVKTKIGHAHILSPKPDVA